MHSKAFERVSHLEFPHVLHIDGAVAGFRSTGYCFSGDQAHLVNATALLATSSCVTLEGPQSIAEDRLGS